MPPENAEGLLSQGPPQQIQQGQKFLLRTKKDLERQVKSILMSSELEMVYQPAVRLDLFQIAFFEALARFPDIPEMAPDDIFSAAAEVGLGTELEMLAARCGLKGLHTLPNGSAVSLNVSPATLLSRDFAKQFAAAPLDRVIVEVTEQHPVISYEPLLEALKPLRDNGLRIAVDDAGAGYSSFRHILQLRPDIIKLDISICRGIHEDPMRQAMASALITFARQTGSELVAEGVETASELQCLRELGMTIIQGHVLARPLPLDCISAEGIRQAANSLGATAPGVGTLAA